jgi:bis(5'-nucleosyl)-tetraphosphatase (symmetrical)
VLHGPDDAYQDFMAQLFGSEPRCWRDDLRGMDRLRCIVNACARLRYCHADGSLNFDEKGRPGTQPAGLLPWFRVPGRRNADLKIVFGHWATLGRYGIYREPGIYALDSGCVWGGQLSALRLDGPGGDWCVDGPSPPAVV